MTAILFLCMVAVMLKRDKLKCWHPRPNHCRWHRCYSNIAY